MTHGVCGLRGQERSRLYGKVLTDDNIREIRADSRPYMDIAAHYDISTPMVSYIKNRKRWAHVEDQ